MDRKLKIEDFIREEKIEELTRDNKMYRGITVDPKTFERIEKLDEEVHGLIEGAPKDPLSRLEAEEQDEEFKVIEEINDIFKSPGVPACD